MEQDKELQKIKEIQLKKMQDAAALQSTIDIRNVESNESRCGNCAGTCKSDLLTELRPDSNYCPACVIQAAQAFALSESFMIEINSNKKRAYAKVSKFNKITNKLENPQIIDVTKMPLISVVGTVDFYKAVPGVKKLGK